MPIGRSGPLIGQWQLPDRLGSELLRQVGTGELSTVAGHGPFLRHDLVETTATELDVG